MCKYILGNILVSFPQSQRIYDLNRNSQFQFVRFPQWFEKNEKGIFPRLKCHSWLDCTIYIMLYIKLYVFKVVDSISDIKTEFPGLWLQCLLPELAWICFFVYKWHIHLLKMVLYTETSMRKTLFLILLLHKPVK